MPAEAMQASWDGARALFDLPGFADLPGERRRIIADDWQAAHRADLAGSLLRRAAEILERVDLRPAALRADLAEGPAGPRRLYFAAELVARAADPLSESAALVHDHERRRHAFGARVAELRDEA